MSKTTQIVRCTLPFLVISILGLLPIVIAMLGALVASLFGESLNEAQAPNIPILGDVLYAMFVMAWFGIATIPLSAFALLVYAVIFMFKVTKILRQESLDPRSTVSHGDMLGLERRPASSLPA